MATTENETTTGTETGQEVETNTEASTEAETTTEETTAEVTTEGDQLPDTHPLVKAHAAQKEKLRTATAAAARVPELEAKVTELETAAAAAVKTEDHTALKARYDRLEEFLSEVGGPLSRALDSRSFSQSLFETDTPVKDIVTKFLKDNPSAVTAALGNTSAVPAAKNPDQNALLRAALSK